MTHIEVGSWQRFRNRGCRGVLEKNLKQRCMECAADGLTPREDELEFDELHVCEIGVDWLVEDSHSHVLHLG